jgi:hypothetical protein
MSSWKREQRRSRCSRRRFLALGMAAGAVVASAARPAVLDAAPARQADPEDQFGRMFQLPPFAAQSPQVEAALMELGKPGGLLDAKDALDQGPVLLITNLALSANNPNNPNHTAGTTFMGQFMDHDMSFDTTSRLGKPTPPQGTANRRTPAFDLDSVYGDGPTVHPQLYDATGLKFRVESGGLFEDLPRASDATAIIADPRNDEHLILAGLHAAVLKFHNNAVDYVKQQGGGGDVFAKARQLTTWHYQWLILNEFLPLFVGEAMVKTILKDGRRYFTPRRDPFIPVEFQGAAYRFGHSMVRPSYRANMKGINGEPFFGLIFDPAEIVKNPQDPTCRAGPGRRGASSAGRRSSTSATAR